MKLLYTSDLHGSKRHYEMLLNFLCYRPCDVLVLGGDMTPDGSWQNPYPHVSEFIRQDYRWFLEQAHLSCNGLSILAVFGNHDWNFAIDEMAALEKQDLVVMLSHDHLVTRGGMNFLGLSYSPPSPHTIKDFERRDTRDSDLTDFDGGVWSLESGCLEAAPAREFFAAHESIEEMLSQAPQAQRDLVFVSHPPPAQTSLDPLPEFGHVGSVAVRRFIETTQPVLSLHGHIHEAPRESGHYTERLGRCLCVNAGQERQRLCAFWWDSEKPDALEHSLRYTP